MASVIDFFGLIGKPMIWRTTIYGDVAVHVAGLSPNGKVATVSIDGGEASTQAQRFAELSDGIGYAILGNLIKRPGRVVKPRVVASKTKRQLVPEDGSHVAKRTRKATSKNENGEVAF